MLVVVVSLLLAQQEAAQTPAPPPAPPPACTGEAHEALDFWVGEWDVYPKGQDTGADPHDLL